MVKRSKSSKRTTSTWTVHTSAKARLTGVAIRIRIRIRDLDRHLPPKFNHLFIGHCQPSLRMSWKSVRKFFRGKLLTDRQTDKQTNNDDYRTSSLAGVMNETIDNTESSLGLKLVTNHFSGPGRAIVRCVCVLLCFRAITFERSDL